MLKKRNLLLVLAAGAALALSADAATATTTYPTTVRFLTGTGTHTEGIVMGQLETNSACRGLRKVTMSKQTSSGYTQVDKILSSARGAWAFRYDLPSTDTQFKFTATRDARNSDVVCEADTYTRTLGPNTRPGTGASSADMPMGTTAYPTNISWQVYGPGSPYAHTAGWLDTNSSRCLGFRKIQMYKLTSSGYRRVDSIFSSSRGAWGFLYESDYPSPDRVRFSTPEVLRYNDNILCGGRTQDETFG
jgi:hypothetical protein